MTFRVAGIGELLWDRFPDGDRLGGAPANFAFHAGQLGADAWIISRVGSDLDGDRLIQRLEARGLATEFVQRDATHPTGSVRVELKSGQPEYIIENCVAWDNLDTTPELISQGAHLDALCFGTLAQRHSVSRRTIQEFILQCPKTTMHFFDINFRQNFYTPEIVDFGLAHATVLKLNEEELPTLAGLFGLSTQTNLAAATIFQRYPLKWIVLTRGAQGCEIHSREQTVHSKAPAISCADAVGAGDAFSAAIVTGLLRNETLQEVAHHANRVGAFVASQSGAMPFLPVEFKTR
jgi:fructokinase